MNGNGKALWWIIGLLTTVLLGVAGNTLTTQQHHTERIATLEAEAHGMNDRLQRIEHKLDLLLERRNHP
jgi:hypothetical protein